MRSLLSAPKCYRAHQEAIIAGVFAKIIVRYSWNRVPNIFDILTNMISLFMGPG